MHKQQVDNRAYLSIVYIEKLYNTWRNQNSNIGYPQPEQVLDKILINLEAPQQSKAHELKFIS